MRLLISVVSKYLLQSCSCSRCNSFEDAALLLEQLRLFDNFVYGVAYGLLMGHQEVWSQARSLFNQLGHMDSPTSSAFYNALTDVLWHFGQVGLQFTPWVHLVY